MQRFFEALICALLALILCSCAPETDFVISQETVEQTESKNEEKKPIPNLLSFGSCNACKENQY